MSEKEQNKSVLVTVVIEFDLRNLLEDGIERILKNTEKIEASFDEITTYAPGVQIKNVAVE